jgi:hypothetical protein
MTEAKEFGSIDDALNGFDPCTDCLRVTEGKYIRGKWSKEPVLCEGKTLNISNFKEI